MTKQLDIVLHSDYPPESCLLKLNAEMDIDHWTLFSLSGYRGEKEMLGRIVRNEFRLHKRRYWHNSSAPVLFGRVTLEGQGGLVEAYWGTWRGPRIFIRVWLGLAIIIAIPFLIGSLRDVMNGKSLARDNLWLGLVVPLALVLWGLLVPRIGAALSFHERKYAFQLLQRVLVARRDAQPPEERQWETSLDSWMG